VFVNFWILWSLLGLAAATALFAWSVGTRQFENSRRAALLPFDDIEPEPRTSAKPVRKNRLLFWSMMLLFLLSMLLLAGTIMMTFQ